MHVNSNGKRYLTPREVSERYGGSISVGTLANWRAAGTSPPFLKIGGKVLYDIDDIMNGKKVERSMEHTNITGNF